MDVPAAVRSAIEMARGMLQRVRAAANPDEALQGVLLTLDGTLTALETTASHAAVERKTKRVNIADNKGIHAIKMLGSDREGFKMWNKKLVNNLANAVGKNWRNYLKVLNEKLDGAAKELTEEQLKDLDGYEELEEKDYADEIMWYVMVEKTEGEAANKVHAGEEGKGLAAYMRVYMWFTGTTGLALSERIRIMMAPKAPVNEHEIADCLDKWAEQERAMRSRGQGYTMQTALKISAIRSIMDNKKEQFESMEREARTVHGGIENEAMFDTLFSKVTEYARQRRLEELHKRDPNRMHIGGVGGAQEQEDSTQQGGQQ